MTIDVRKKEAYTYQEALDHLKRLLNAPTYAKITKAITCEIERQSIKAVSEELAHQEYGAKYFS